MKQSANFVRGLLLAAQVSPLWAPAVHAQRLERPEALRLRSEDAVRLELRRGDTAFDHYPPAAKRDAIDGVVLVDMLLNAEGQVLEAQVVAEAPKGFGFGLAALDAAKTFEFVNPYKRQVLLSRQLDFLP